MFKKKEKKNGPRFLFIPPGWSPHVPCRHISRCCIWRSLFISLYIFDCNFMWPTEVQTIVSYHHVNPDLCRVWGFSCFWWDYTMFWNWYDFFFFLVWQGFDSFSVLFSSLYYWERFNVPQLISVVECELRDCNRRAVFVFFFAWSMLYQSLHFILE